MSEGIGKRRRGRPTLPTESVKQHAVSVRVRAGLKDLLVKASAESNRSVAAEIETRLWSSFAPAPPAVQRELPDVLEDEFGPQGAALMLAIGCLVELCLELRLPGRRSRSKWLSNPQLFGQVAEGIKTLLQTMDPAVDPAVLEHFRRIAGLDEDQLADLVRDDPKVEVQSEALVIADEIGFLDLGIGIGVSPWAERIKDWLGEAALKRVRDRMPPAHKLEE
jgi:hypothetical protein